MNTYLHKVDLATLKGIRNLFQIGGRGKVPSLGNLLKQRFLFFIVTGQERAPPLEGVMVGRIVRSNNSWWRPSLSGRRLEGPPLDPPMEGASASYRDAPSTYPGCIRVFIRSSLSSGSDLSGPLEGAGSYFGSSATIMVSIPTLAEGLGSELAVDTSQGYDIGLPKE
ncbi:LOW QUALITY PROTEIN: hypothetical protein Cgig2_023001 [Carnegiea gigantea]|uniref:Uncharacterized protein n=1 Tax=Carnegiea gigantea TaxID=171969 RepID=A0A9Q1KBD5_9CARY|nr:LOW QUALITY PROTEIN: hypothetical protein Cgig2_023001 [Carnegiea gigantea]